MPTDRQSLREQIPDAHTWADLERLYKDTDFITPPAEAVEADGVTYHGLGSKLSNLQTFWRYHVAPATNRPVDNHLDASVSEIIVRLAQRSYEVYANIFDALEELKDIKDPKPPRYRSCLNILRCVGDACLLFDELIAVLGAKEERTKTKGSKRDSLAKALGVEIVFFKDWGKDYWSKERRHVADYRHMLVHHGRPWLFFEGKTEHVGWPLVLEAEYCRVPNTDNQFPEYLSWNEQKSLYAKDRDKFVPLPKACKDTCSDGLKWLNRAYQRVNDKLEGALKNRETFEQYKTLWGISD